MNCRHCDTPLRAKEDLFLDLGIAPPSNAYLSNDDLGRGEWYLPLRVLTCASCRLVQLDETVRRDSLFSSDYAYFSSYSSSWLAHAKRYVELAADRLALDHSSLIVEVASNDGYLLQAVVARGIPCVGIEPTAGTASAARAKGIETIEQFFGEGFAREFASTRRRADLIVANNVLAHVPDINDFASGFRELLTADGTVTVEFPHLLELVAHAQFDTIYHEHYSYLSLHTVQRIFAANGLRIWDVETLTTHGGSLRVWAQLASNTRDVGPNVDAVLNAEVRAGLLTPSYYVGMQQRVERIKDDFVTFLIDAKRRGRKVMGYGAAAKGNTLLNFAGIKHDLIMAVADASPHKQGKYLPGSRIPVVAPEVLDQLQPDYIVLFPWNLRDELMTQLAHARRWGAQFVTAVPELSIS